METENILPALLDTKPPNQMSSKEFQRMLYTWFEEKGLVSDLRSYLRVLMINQLRNTSIGKIDQNKTNFSLPKQAFCLVIAEHLLREGCHYTLSIFSTEVPGIANQLPFSLYEAHCNKENETWRFDQESVLNVLELIGISKNSNESLKISALYFRNYGSLLTCLINSKTEAQESKIETKENEDVDNYLNRVLSVIGAPPNVIDDVRKTIHQNRLKERDENNLLAQKHFQKMIDDLNLQLAEKDNQIKQLINEQIDQKQEQKKLKHELKEMRKHTNQLILQEKSVKMKENMVKEKLKDISKLEQNLKDSVNKDEILKNCPQKHCTESCQNNLQIKEELQKQVLKAHEIDKEKTAEIERLNTKIALLFKDLESSQMKIEFLNSCLLRSNQINLQDQKFHEISDDSSDNVTKEVLKQVRSKLQELDRESDELDIKFRELKIK